MLTKRGVRLTGLAIAMGAMLPVAISISGGSGFAPQQAHAAARAPELPKKKRSSLFSWPRVKASPSRPESRPEDDKGRFITKRRICRNVNGKRVCFHIYNVRSKRGRSYMIEREDIWRR